MMYGHKSDSRRAGVSEHGLRSVVSLPAVEAGQYEGRCDGDEDTVLHTTIVTLYCCYYSLLFYGFVGLHC